MKKPSKKMIQMHQLGVKCVKQLMKDKQCSEDDATQEVLKFINSSTHPDPDMLMAAMKMTFLGESVAQASQPLIDKILK